VYQNESKINHSTKIFTTPKKRADGPATHVIKAQSQHEKVLTGAGKAEFSSGALKWLENSFTFKEKQKQKGFLQPNTLHWGKGAWPA